MKEQTNLAPKRRFKEFSDTLDWEQGELGEVTEVYDGTHQTPDYKEEGIMFLSVENIKTLQSNKYISVEAFEKEFNVRPEKGDVLMTRIGDVGTANVVTSNEPIAYYVSLALLKKKNLNPYFLQASIHSFAVQDEIWKRTLHIAFPKKINKNEIAKVPINFPSEQEQDKIGLFFKELDNLSTLHQLKLEKMRALKSAYLSEMFPAEGELVPKRRFAGFTDTWEQRELGDMIFKMYGGASIAPDDYKDGGVATVPKGAVNSSGIADLSGSKYVDELFYNKNSNASVYQNELVTSLRDLVPTAPNMGRIVKLKGSNEKYLMPQGVYRLIINSDADENFLISFSNTDRFRKIISEEKNGSTQVHIRNSEYLGIPIARPSKEEQQRIGSFFKQLDNLIALHQRKLEKLQNLKKAYLNEMFV